MGQLSVASSSHPLSRNQKIIAAIAAVVVGHAGVLLALSYMKPMQLRPVDPPKPVQVRFVKIVEKPKAELPKPKEPEKPKEPPKPKQVKIVEKPLPPPKKVEKVQQVKAPTPKPVELPQAETKIVTTTTAVVTTPQPAPKAEPAPAPEPAPQVDNSPRNLGDASGVAWKRKPKPRLSQDDLKSVTSTSMIIRIDVDDKGRIKARIKQGSGNAKVDREVIRAVQAGQFYPHKEDGVAVPFYAEQPFHLQ
ncbi:energy transducer TonB [Acinetobacter puyangensis]|uniref:Outer membrane transport energization protein TonB n=2 Tax=Acinetobacter puyangensis TaxID=1096779 RepID=A0A240E3K4_9GAMM|nr:energy transducer TonB [Acinetobacter puyangensis]SNX43354.1 outer membrane transport energization protein TonB [Acinetobacter puyangensis]